MLTSHYCSPNVNAKHFNSFWRRNYLFILSSVGRLRVMPNRFYGFVKRFNRFSEVRIRMDWPRFSGLKYRRECQAPSSRRNHFSFLFFVFSFSSVKYALRSHLTNALLWTEKCTNKHKRKRPRMRYVKYGTKEYAILISNAMRAPALSPQQVCVWNNILKWKH